MNLSVREMGRNGESKEWRGARNEGYYKWVTINHCSTRKTVLPDFKLQKSLTCLSVTNQHKLELSQQCDRQAGKPSVLPGIGKWPIGLTYSTLHGPPLVFMTLHPFFFLFISPKSEYYLFSLWEDPIHIYPGDSGCFLDPSLGCSNRRVRGTLHRQERCCASKSGQRQTAPALQTLSWCIE